VWSFLLSLQSYCFRISGKCFLLLLRFFFLLLCYLLRLILRLLLLLHRQYQPQYQPALSDLPDRKDLFFRHRLHLPHKYWLHQILHCQPALPEAYWYQRCPVFRLHFRPHLRLLPWLRCLLPFRLCEVLQDIRLLPVLHPRQRMRCMDLP